MWRAKLLSEMAEATLGALQRGRAATSSIWWWQRGTTLQIQPWLVTTVVIRRCLPKQETPSRRHLTLMILKTCLVSPQLPQCSTLKPHNRLRKLNAMSRATAETGATLALHSTSHTSGKEYFAYFVSCAVNGETPAYTTCTLIAVVWQSLIGTM